MEELISPIQMDFEWTYQLFFYFRYHAARLDIYQLRERKPAKQKQGGSINDNQPQYERNECSQINEW